MSEHNHPSSDSPTWENPDFCPFCGQQLPDGGPGFYDHVQMEENAKCRERFDDWHENIADDIGGEWSG